MAGEFNKLTGLLQCYAVINECRSRAFTASLHKKPVAQHFLVVLFGLGNLYGRSVNSSLAVHINLRIGCFAIKQNTENSSLLKK